MPHCPKCGREARKNKLKLFACKRCGLLPSARLKLTRQENEETRMLGLFKKKFTESAQKMSGKTDLLEAVCAACALVAAADGTISDEEIESTAKAVAANATLQSAFDKRQIEEVANRMLNRAESGRVGKAELAREIREVAGGEYDRDTTELVLLAAYDVAESDGNVDPAEMAVLEKIAADLGLKMADYV